MASGSGWNLLVCRGVSRILARGVLALRSHAVSCMWRLRVKFSGHDYLLIRRASVSMHVHIIPILAQSGWLNLVKCTKITRYV